MVNGKEGGGRMGGEWRGFYMQSSQGLAKAWELDSNTKVVLCFVWLPARTV